MAKNNLELRLYLLISNLVKLKFCLIVDGWLWGRLVYVSALCLDDGELLIVVSSDLTTTAISDYGKRWGIETLLGMFKTRGFCLESTHFNDLERLSLLNRSNVLGLRHGQLKWANGYINIDQSKLKSMAG